MELKDKVAVVTGGGVRVGRAIVLALAAEGCHVFIHYGRSAGPARETQAEARGCGVRAEIFSADLAQAAAVEMVIPAALEAFGRVDILINSAAIFPEEDRFAETDAALWDQLFAINARAPFLLNQAFAAQVAAGGQGKIIHVNDARIPRPAPDHFAYRLAKRALWDMTAILAVELAPRITVNQVALGAILPPPGQPQSYLDRVADERVPLKRPGSPEIVAENILHLLRQDFLTGVTIELDGGEFI